MMTCPLEEHLVSSYFRRPSGTALIEWENLASTTCNRKYPETPCQWLDSGWISDHNSKMQCRIAWHPGLWKKLPLSGYNNIRSLSIILSNSAFRKYRPQTLSAKQFCVL
jgi:hypothetical protein